MTRQELYDLIWSAPAKTIAPRFGISDVALSKICEKHEIPQPPRGHWAKVAAGKPVASFPLPSRGLGIPGSIDFSRDRWGYRRIPDNLTELDLGPRPTFEEPVADVIAKVRKLVGKVTVPRDLSRAHHAIQSLLAEDDRRREAYLSKSYRSPYDAPFFDSPFEKRRLRFINAIALTLAKLGCRPSFSRRKDIEGIGYKVGLQELGMAIDEPGYTRHGWRSSEDLVKSASTALRVKINVGSDAIQTEWIDKGNHRVEDDITDIVVMAIVAGELSYRDHEVGYHDRLVEIKERRIEDARKAQLERERKERERLEGERKARIEGLLLAAGQHRQANDIRAYVDAVRGAKVQASAEQIEQWAAWALAQADDLDPLVGFQIGE